MAIGASGVALHTHRDKVSILVNIYGVDSDSCSSSRNQTITPSVGTEISCYELLSKRLRHSCYSQLKSDDAIVMR